MHKTAMLGTILAAVLGAACGPLKETVTPPTGTPAWLMSVFTLPSGTETGDDLQNFAVQLKAVANPATYHAALRTPRASVLSNDPMWKARLAYESARRQGIDRVIDDVRAGRRSLHSTRSRASCSTACDTSHMCWKGTCTASVAMTFADGVTPLTANVVDVISAGSGNAATQINILLDATADTSTARAAALDAAQKFASTFNRELTLLGQSGHTGALDRDQDGRMTVVFTNSNGNDAGFYGALVGFFSFNDFLPAGTSHATGNEADLLWVRVPGVNNSTASMAAGTMAHEYTHLVSYAQRVQARGNDADREVVWLDEGIAHSMEDLTGWSVSNIRVVEEALGLWGVKPFAYSEDSIAQRGRACLLVRHLIDQKARAGGATSASSTALTTAASTVLSSLINESAVGWQHSAFQTLGAEGVWHWLLSVHATGSTQVNHPEAHAYDYLDVGTDATTGNTIGINPRGSYVDTNNTALTLTGPAVEELDDSSPDLSDDIPQSATPMWRAVGFNATGAKLTSELTSPTIGPFLRVLQTEGTPQGTLQ